MNIRSPIALIALLVSLGACTTALAGQGSRGVDSSQMVAFPPAKTGQKRYVIALPARDREGDLKVELIVGKTMMVDCNHHFFGGRLEERTAPGWGYNFYVLEGLGQGASTLMGCPPHSSRKLFVRSSDEMLVRYNSRLPLVVYTPADTEVRYRVWQAGREQVAR